MTSPAETISRHFSAGLLIRLAFVAYSLIHDRYFDVKFSDADYSVFSNGAKAVSNWKSPYEEDAEYRYSPLVAYLLLPNIVLHRAFGKLLFAVADLLVAVAIYKIVFFFYRKQSKALQCSKLWLYNLFSVIIASRGNSDSLIALLVLLVLYSHLQRRYLVSGIILGLAVHLRLYPIIFLLPLYVTISDNSSNTTTRTAVEQIYSPLKDKLKFLIAGFAVTYGLLTYTFYYLYGDPFLQQTILYHLNRLDVRHNFSVHFYQLYLDFNQNNADLVTQFGLVASQLIAIVYYTFTYNQLEHLNFAMFCVAFTFVTFNKVITAQYIIWYLSLLPIFLPTISLSRNKVISLVGLWFFGQAVWLGSAYALEFEGYNTFICIWLSSLSVLVINVYILRTFIERYNSEIFNNYKRPLFIDNKKD